MSQMHPSRSEEASLSLFYATSFFCRIGFGPVEDSISPLSFLRMACKLSVLSHNPSIMGLVVAFKL
jgi:hypothetical protein